MAQYQADASDQWYPVPIDVWKTPFDASSAREDSEYTPLEKASKQWRICASFPHMKDAYWLAVNYGIVDEVKRLGASLKLYEAGGYGNLGVQKKQITDCLKWNPDGLILSAISETDLNDLISDIAGQGIPVIDLINGVSSPDIAAKSQVTFYDMGHLAGEYIVELTKPEGRPIRVAWFPGPEGAGWVKAGDQGINDATKGSHVEIVSTRHGDTGENAQAKLINEALDEDGAIDFIVGTAVTAEAAISIVRKRKLSKQIRIMSYYFGPGVHKGIKRGNILAAPSDKQAVQGRIAVDQVIRILEKKPYLKHVAPKPEIVTRATLENFDLSTSLPPRGFRATFDVN